MNQDFYDIPNFKADAIREQRGMRVHAWRGIGAGYNKFVSESFVDEISAARGVDPLAMRLELTKNHPRASAVINAVAEMADWKRKRPGRGLGLAFADYHDTLTAGVAEISIDRATGKIKVHNYWIAADPGLVIHPENALAQIESAVIYGLSGALSEELTVKDGAVQQSNFGDYHVAAHERCAPDPHAHSHHQQPAHRDGRDRPPVRRARDRQRGRATHRQAAAPPADVAGAGEEGAGVGVFVPLPTGSRRWRGPPGAGTCGRGGSQAHSCLSSRDVPWRPAVTEGLHAPHRYPGSRSFFRFDGRGRWPAGRLQHRTHLGRHSGHNGKRRHIYGAVGLARHINREQKVLEPPEADSRLALVDVRAANAAAAVAAGWASYRPDATRPFRLATPQAPPEWVGRAALLQL
jgi:hypothetical protein